MERARWQRTRGRRAHRGVRHDPRPRRRQRQGWRGQVVGHREPRGRARGTRSHASACSTPTSGGSASRACSASTAASAAPTARSTRTRCRSQRRRPRTVAPGTLQGRVDGVPRRRRGHRAHVARAHPHQGARAVPHRRAVGRPRLPAHRHAAGHRRHPDGTRPHAPAGRDARGHHAGASRRSRSRRASPTWRAART